MPIKFAPKVGKFSSATMATIPYQSANRMKPAFMMATFHQKW